MPCADSAPDINNIGTSYSIATSDDIHQHSHQDGKDDCSPFCVCQCCGDFLSISNITTFNAERAKIYFAYALPYSFNYYHDYTKGIWHPPTDC